MDNDKFSTICSLLLHVLLFLALFYSSSTHILATARSSGMEVGLIPETAITPPKIPVNQPVVTQTVIANNPQAEVKLSAQPIKQVTPVPTPISTPLPVKVHLITTKPLKPKKPIKKPIPNKQLSDLLNNLAAPVSENNPTGQSKVAATRGIAVGSNTNTDNLIASYADAVIALLRPLINIPSDINSNNVAIFEVTLLPNMQVYQVNLIKPSGNPSYDDNIRDAILNKIAAFPPLPAGAKFIDYRKLRLTFRPV